MLWDSKLLHPAWASSRLLDLGLGLTDQDMSSARFCQKYTKLTWPWHTTSPLIQLQSDLKEASVGMYCIPTD